MSVDVLQRFLPSEACVPFLKKWFGNYPIHIKIKKERNSKLGDYRKMPNKTHQITLNATLVPQLFFFVLTHELAHLLAFEIYGRGILPHGKEWKQTYREMLLESISVYETSLQPLILKFAKSPKANFMASPDLVRYFYGETMAENQVFIEDLPTQSSFVYNGKRYILLGKKHRHYLCESTENGRKYLFKSLARVEKMG
ncbi:MAG: SprT-like domain-containing protein [Bergeyella zoohelcum]|nr:SprT-like domain-containing protein [Bergeyella zoohelcum]